MGIKSLFKGKQYPKSSHHQYLYVVVRANISDCFCVRWSTLPAVKTDEYVLF